jgi:hypothetical protein
VLSVSRILRFLVCCSMTILNQRMIDAPKSSYASVFRKSVGIVKTLSDFGFFGRASKSLVISYSVLSSADLFR